MGLVMRREEVERLRAQALDVLDSYNVHEENIQAREEARELIENYAEQFTQLDGGTVHAMRVIEEIASEGMDVPQQRVIDAIDKLRQTMHE